MQFKKSFELHLFANYVHMYQCVHVDVVTFYIKTPPENHVPDGAQRRLRTSIYKGIVNVEVRLRYSDCSDDHCLVRRCKAIL